MMKRCSTCKEEKAFSEFSKSKSQKDGLQSYCKVCKKARDKAYYESNREKIRDQKKAYREANREKVLAYQKAWYEANREEMLARHKAWYESNREKRSAYMKAYHEANPDKRRETWQKRRARKLALPAEDVKLSVLRERDGDTCYLCEDVIDFDGPHKLPNGGLNPYYPNIDHVIPVARGGSHTYDNTKLAHAICNFQKYDKILEEEDTQ